MLCAVQASVIATRDGFPSSFAEFQSWSFEDQLLLVPYAFPGRPISLFVALAVLSSFPYLMAWRNAALSTQFSDIIDSSDLEHYFAYVWFASIATLFKRWCDEDGESIETDSLTILAPLTIILVLSGFSTIYCTRNFKRSMACAATLVGVFVIGYLVSTGKDVPFYRSIEHQYLWNNGVLDLGLCLFLVMAGRSVGMSATLLALSTVSKIQLPIAQEMYAKFKASKEDEASILK